MTVYLVGNESVVMDSLATQLHHELQKAFPDCTFTAVDPTENFIPEEGSIILDTVQGIDKVTVFTSLLQFSDHSMVSPHDYDLYFHLKLLQKLGMIQDITIVGLPMGKTAQRIFEQVVVLLESYLKTR